MVKIAVTGASSGLAREVIDRLVDDAQHEVVALVRRNVSGFPAQKGVQWVQTAYEADELVQLFAGVEVVLDFIILLDHGENVVARRLVDAAVAAGVKRYAASEWAMGEKLEEVVDFVPWYRSKVDTRQYLREINREGRALEYCLFQPGLIMEFTAFPRRVAKHLTPVPTMWQLDVPRVVCVAGCEDVSVTVTSMADVAAIVRRAVDYAGPWPAIGGMQGTQTTAFQACELLRRVRGHVVLDTVSQVDLTAGRLTVDMPVIAHPSIPEESRDGWHALGWIGTLRAAAAGAWAVSDEWNNIFSDHQFTSLEDFVRRTWP